MLKTLVLLIWSISGFSAGEADSLHVTEAAGMLVGDSASNSSSIHRLDAEFLPATILHTNDYLTGSNSEKRTMNHANTYRLKYAFQAPPHSMQARIYGNPYQGIGMAYHEFNHQTGNPLSIYVFQGATIKRWSQRLSLNYEWNFGLTMGWKPYDKYTNPENHIIGSKVTAYMDADVYLNWRLSDAFDVNLGAQVSHFSNGNTKLPNSGLNTLGAKIGMTWRMNRGKEARDVAMEPVPAFQRHVSYDAVVFGAWRSKGLIVMGSDGTDIIPGSAGVFGFSFSPTWNISHKLNAAISLDGFYDRSANLEVRKDFHKLESYEDRLRSTFEPSADRQVMVGLSARAEFVMPYFTINAGIGHSVYGKGDMNAFYQIIALKVNIIRRTYLHIGYSLHDFKLPNHLMLGIGYRIMRSKR
ncbi:MAG: acyloxyacyl hydrolase [Prevotella sp.]|nr:acyloxyacyl hydrolase [Prevotella sp.]MBR1464184.1 acyloxyacyl hydrolase [Prevotella sp.]